MFKKVVEINEEKPLFQLIFLKVDEDQSVEVEEVEEIDFTEVERRLKQGESVFITSKPKQKPKVLVAKEEAAEPWFFYHI